MRRGFLAAAVLAVEGYLYWRYGARGALFHFWLHGLFGAALGLSVGALLRCARPQRRSGEAWSVGLAGHLYSAAPDIAFVAAGVLHYRWMDAFALHVSLHFVPAPLVVAFAVFALALLGHAAATLDRGAVAVALVGLAAVTTVAAVAVRAPIPQTLDEVREPPRVALLCPLAGPSDAG